MWTKNVNTTGGDGPELKETLYWAMIIEDRHCDAEVEVSFDKEKAIRYARHLAKKYCKYEEDYCEHDTEGWDFHAVYSCEGDSIRVVKVDFI